MTIAQTAAVPIGRLGLATAAFGRPSFAGAGVGTALYELVVNTAIATGWLTERRTLLGRSLERDAKIMVGAKDVLVTGTVLAGAATLAGNVAAWLRSSAAVDDDHPYLRKMIRLNRSLARLGVASAPFINFALYDSYHPHPLRSFFSLW
ncbi:hypothetical protein FDA94_10455 [Herbidospora galbida]|uniref:Uncharacterized protein n=1 Tax=Herbidospora galbida TaxID=2575442 RepID=A0A4U3MJ36_9ACTN|nr:hypothetical protein [Herbidospora galbida]TKK89341.1 hypothetical protein FDA94_10455 [Herbidospora galbida]